MKIRHCFFSPVLFEVFPLKIAACCSGCRELLLTETAFPCAHGGFGSDAALPYSTETYREMPAPPRCWQGEESSPLPSASSELLTPCGGNLPHNNAVIDIDGARCSHFIFSDACFQGCEKSGCGDQRSKP